MTPTITQPKPLGTPPSREKLILWLKNGPDFIDITKKNINDFKLPYTIEISDGTILWEDIYGTDPVPQGYGILRDTLSRGEIHLNSFITVEKDTLAMKEDARKMSRADYEVLIIGDTGTGKEILAKSMIGNRKGHIKAINCAGMPEHLIESELFGHKRGSFTGAESDKQGLMASASDGVMFLDEIGEMPLQAQAKLLRALQEKKIRRVGSNVDEEITCKIVCATNRDLRAMVKEGTFRKDLYARISTLELHIKPLLPDRKEDIIPITESMKGGKEFLAKYKDEILEGTLKFPYNVRSIYQYVTRFSVLGRIVLEA